MNKIDLRLLTAGGFISDSLVQCLLLLASVTLFLNISLLLTGEGEGSLFTICDGEFHSVLQKETQRQGKGPPSGSGATNWA